MADSADRQSVHPRPHRRVHILCDQRLLGDTELRADPQSAALPREAGIAHLPRPICRDTGIGVRAGTACHDITARRLFEPAGTLRICPRQHTARSDRPPTAGYFLRRQPHWARDQWLAVDLAPRIHDVPDGTPAGPIATADRASGVPAAGLWYGLSVFRDALSARKVGLVFRIAQRLGLARRLLCCGNGFLQTAP